MVKLNKIYTKTGDDGTTGLADGSRVSKDHRRVQAYGAVDEANAALGLATLHLSGAPLKAVTRIQNDLFDLGADLATPMDGNEEHALRIVASQVRSIFLSASSPHYCSARRGQNRHVG
jgi:cob(I)alamin adenosyltransferase